jgi:mono/diheme cytochrome c family protein
METALLAGALVLALLALDKPAPGQVPAAETARMERIAEGRLSYRIHCASCHGESGRGDGPLSEQLKVRPADLTRLAASHEGIFPRAEVYDSIDGRRKVRSHGTATMPVWGATFQDPGRDTPQDREVRERILDLVAYVESIQAAP